MPLLTLGFGLLFFFVATSAQYTCHNLSQVVRDTTFAAQWSSAVNGDDCCSWPAIVCDDTNNVTEIDMGRWSITGTIHLDNLPPSLVSLKMQNLYLHGAIETSLLPEQLSYADLSGNLLVGTLDLTHLPSQMQYLDLRGNSFLGTVDLTRLPDGLFYLHLFGCNFQGSVDLTKLPSMLAEIYLAMNSFTGTLDISNLPPYMRYIEIYSNQFQGTLQLSAMPRSMTNFLAHDCAFQGTVPLHIMMTKQRSMSNLHLENNRFSGTLSLSSVPPYIRTLRLSGNSFTGSIELPQMLRSLITLYISNNGLSGTLNLSISSVLQDFQAAQNRFTGTISLPSLRKGVTTLTLNGNLLTGTLDMTQLPSTLQTLRLDNNGFTGQLQLKPLPAAAIFINNNQLSGTVDFQTIPSAMSVSLQLNNLGGSVDLSGGLGQCVELHLDQNSFVRLVALPPFDSAKQMWLGANPWRCPFPPGLEAAKVMDKPLFCSIPTATATATPIRTTTHSSVSRTPSPTRLSTVTRTPTPYLPSPPAGPGSFKLVDAIMWAGIGAGGVVLLLGLIYGVYRVARRRRKPNPNSDTLPLLDFMGQGDSQFRRTERVIGRGGCGVVYEGIELATFNVIVLKEIGGAARGFDAELQMLSQIYHPRVVRYLGVHVEGNRRFLAMEYLHGGSLAALLRRAVRLAPDFTARATGDVLQGLEYLHQRHIVHRDLKPGNLLLDAAGNCKLADFGLAHLKAGEEPSAASRFAGTLLYLSPEALHGTVDAPVDIWALGLTVLQLLTGERPWPQFEPTALMYQLSQPEVPEHPIPNDLDDDAVDFIRHCIATRPQDRSTASQLLKHAFVERRKAQASSVIASEPQLRVGPNVSGTGGLSLQYDE
eukprot:TRINITY_DN27943_c0_g1_i1.p1 TRINITY_DN27943_c0_g1~~TRINITY_DN27943_c0_g1_i1.p1  ORF type:complete len:882 (+),score=136.63 TRINITY_DN27943_c0_g1_i1:32-2647(+)